MIERAPWAICGFALASTALAIWAGGWLWMLAYSSSRLLNASRPMPCWAVAKNTGGRLIGSTEGASSLADRPVSTADKPMKFCRFWSLMASLLGAGGLGTFKQESEIGEAGAR